MFSYRLTLPVYVGADHVAMQLATGMGEADVLKRGNVIALDICLV
jgi:hypothetical protein